MRPIIIAALVFIPLPAIGGPSSPDNDDIGCIRLDTEELGLDPWEAWQTWCELDEALPLIKCSDYEDEKWIERVQYAPEHVLERQHPGIGNCAFLPRGAPPRFRD